MSSWKVAVAAGTAVAVLGSGAVASAAPAAVASGVLAPGSAVIVYKNDGSSGERCTAGFVARNVNNAAVMFTAGHCNVGDRVMLRDSDGAMKQAAEIVVSQFDGISGEDTDIAVMRPLGVAPLVSSIDGLPVRSVERLVYGGEWLCFLGATSGKSCGPVVQISDSKVKFAAKIAAGDSGGPVWVETPDGSASAVGIVIRRSEEKWAVAELLAPWMKRYRLDI